MSVDAEYGYEVAKSWLRACAENRMWAMVQPSSGGFSQFSAGYQDPNDPGHDRGNCSQSRSVRLAPEKVVAATRARLAVKS